MRPFLTGFMLTLLLFLAANVLAAHFMSDCGLPAFFHLSGCADDIRRAGFPLQFYEQGGFAFHSSFDQDALAFDIVIGLAVSIASGLAAGRFWKKTVPPHEA